MNPVLLSICLALHTLSTVLLIGIFALSALVVLPVLRRIAPEEGNDPGATHIRFSDERWGIFLLEVF